jgi:TRAP-type C4-dicarboxylate transport system permease small subunit
MRAFAIAAGSVAGVLLAAIFAALAAQIALRPFGILFPWVEEFATLAFVTMIFFAVALAHATDEHLAVDFVRDAVQARSARGGAALRVVNGLAEFVFLVVFLFGLVLMTRQTWGMFAGSISGFRLGYVYLASAVGVSVSVAVLLGRLLLRRRARETAAKP